MGCWHGYVSGSRCRFAYGPADATGTHCQAMWMYLNRGGVDAALLPIVIDRFSRQLESVRGRILRSQTRRLAGVCVAGR